MRVALTDFKQVNRYIYRTTASVIIQKNSAVFRQKQQQINVSDYLIKAIKIRSLLLQLNYY